MTLWNANEAVCQQFLDMLRIVPVHEGRHFCHVADAGQGLGEVQLHVRDYRPSWLSNVGGISVSVPSAYGQQRTHAKSTITCMFKRIRSPWHPCISVPQQ